MQKIVNATGTIDAAFWNAVEAFAWPVLWLLATPLFLARLGSEQFGLLMFVNAIAMLGGAVGLGIGPAVIKLVAAANGRGDALDAARTVRAALTVSLSIGFLLCGAVWLARTGVAQTLFHRLGTTADTSVLLMLGSITLALQQVDSVLGAGLKGLERFDLSALLDVIVRLGMIGGMLAAVWLSASVYAVVYVQQICIVSGSLLKRSVLQRQLAGQRLLPGFDMQRMRHLTDFGKWVWLQNIAGIVVFAADRLVVAAFFGAHILSAYSICQQGAQVIHTAVVACFQRLFPSIGSVQQSVGRAALRDIVVRSIKGNLLVALAIFSPTILMSDHILALWIGTEFANANQRLFQVFLAVNLLLAINVSSYFILLGLGRAKLVGIYTAVGAALSIALLLILTPVWGPVGAASARLPYVLIALLFIGKALQAADSQPAVARSVPQGRR